MRLDVESLRAFRSVVECDTVTQAASQLNLTQSAVSWKMKRLEQRLGSPLFVRNGRELALTELGSELLAHADQIVTAHDEAVDSLQHSQLRGTVHLGINDELGADVMASLLARFQRRHPKVRLHVRMGLSGNIAQLVRGGELDLALIQVLDTDVHDTVLWSESLEWIASPTYVPDVEMPLPLVTFGPSSSYRTTMDGILRRAGIEHYVAFESESSAGVRSAVAAGFGVALINERCVTDECPIWDLADFAGVTDRGGDVEHLPTVSFVLRVNSRSRTTAVRTLVDEIRSSLSSFV